MAASSYSDKELESYLRNELPDDEIAALEDKLLRDDELFQRLETVEMSLFDRYLENEMADEEKQRFEETFLSNPANQAKLDEAHVFRESLELVRPKEASPAGAAIVPIVRQGFFSSLRLPELAAAAIILILIAALIAYFAMQSRNQKPNDLIADTIPRPTPEISPTPTQQLSPPPDISPSQRPSPARIQEQWLYLRDMNTGVMGSSDDLLIPLAPGAETLRLRFELLEDVRTRDVFHVSVKDQMGYPVLNTIEVTPIQIRYRGLRRRALSVDIPVINLKPRERYRFEIADVPPPKTFVISR